MPLAWSRFGDGLQSRCVAADRPCEEEGAVDSGAVREQRHPENCGTRQIVDDQRDSSRSHVNTDLVPIVRLSHIPGQQQSSNSLRDRQLSQVPVLPQAKIETKGAFKG